jgi:hypothetical protein
MTQNNSTKKEKGFWNPPDIVSREECIKSSHAILTLPDIKIKQHEDIFRIRTLEKDWDIGAMIYEPMGSFKVSLGADRKKIGIFLLSGGDGDYKSMEYRALVLAGKFGYKVVTMTYPGRLYFDAPSRNWLGDTIYPDGTVRTPIWKKGELITPDQYEVIKDDSMRMKYGIRTVARAKPGTIFYYRMAGWPVAFEEGGKEAMRRHFPENEYSIYAHGHSTGGPFVSMLSQRVANITGILAIENSPFGYINEKKHAWSGGLGRLDGYKKFTKKENKRFDKFNDLYIITWKSRARYMGTEALGQEGPKALMRLPWLMEEVLEEWNKRKSRPNFKAEYMITYNIVPSLIKAARVTAERLQLNPKDTENLIERYLGYTRELSGSEVKPVPPFLFGITKNSRDHSPEVYREVILPMFKRMNPAPKVAITRFLSGVHGYTKPEKSLPMGVAPAVFQLWDKAIRNGFFVVD